MEKPPSTPSPDSDAPYDFAPVTPAPKPAPRPAPEPVSDLPKVTTAPVLEQVCPVCAFKMLGKTKRARCPECGAPLDAATADFLQFSETPWLRTLTRGAAVLAVAPLAHIAGGALSWSGLPFAVLLAIHLAGGAALALGTWLITIPDPRRDRPRSSLMPLFARLATAVTAVMWLAMLVLALIHKLPPANWPLIVPLLPLAASVLLLGFHLSAVAARVPNDGLSGQFQTLGWLVSGIVLFLAAYEWFAQPTLIGSLFFCSFPMIGGIVGILLWAATTPGRLALDLRNAVKVSEEIAAKHAERLSTAPKSY